MKKRLLQTAAILLLLLLTAPAEAQQRKAEKALPRPQPQAAISKTHLLLILDCSKSMWETWQSDSKIKVTQQVLLRFLDSIARQKDIDVALRVFGHLNSQSYGTRLEVPFEEDNLYKLQSKLKTLVPSGGCDAASALTSSLDDFAQLGSERNIILIITDGIDDCSGDICEVARHVQMSGVIVQTFILGIGNGDNFKQNLACAGRLTLLPSEEKYSDALFDVLRQADEAAHVTLSVTDSDGLPYETSFPVAFYDSQTGIVRYTTIYSCADKASADTLTIDPLVSYDVTLFTKPEIRLHRQTFPPNKVTTLKVQVNQGRLSVRFDGQKTTWVTPAYQVLVRQQDKPQVLNRQTMGDKVSYASGLYDIEVLSQPSIVLRGVEIRSDATTDLTMLTPGMLTLSKPKQPMVGSLFTIRDGRLTWVRDINPATNGERILLMPGDYQLVIKPQKASDFSSVRSVRFTIASAQLSHITL